MSWPARRPGDLSIVVGDEDKARQIAGAIAAEIAKHPSATVTINVTVASSIHGDVIINGTKQGGGFR